MLEIADLVVTDVQETPTEALERLGWFEIEDNHDIEGKHFAYRTSESAIPEELILLLPKVIYTWDDNYPKWLPFYIPVDSKNLEIIDLDFHGIIIHRNSDDSFRHHIGVRMDVYSSDFMVNAIQALLYLAAIPNILILIVAYLFVKCRIFKYIPMEFWALEDCTIVNLFSTNY